MATGAAADSGPGAAADDGAIEFAKDIVKGAKGRFGVKGVSGRAGGSIELTAPAVDTRPGGGQHLEIGTGGTPDPRMVKRYRQHGVLL